METYLTQKSTSPYALTSSLSAGQIHQNLPPTKYIKPSHKTLHKGTNKNFIDYMINGPKKALTFTSPFDVRRILAAEKQTQIKNRLLFKTLCFHLALEHLKNLRILVFKIIEPCFLIWIFMNGVFKR